MAIYKDFIIRIHPARDGVFPVQVQTPMSSTGHGELRLPFDLDTLGTMRADLGRMATRAFSHQAGDPAPPITSQQFGCKLYQALFTGDVAQLLNESVARIRERNRDQADQQMVRLKLQMDLHDPSLAPLASLPWELLCHEATGAYLSLDPATTLVRFLDVLTPFDVRPFVPPLRILMVSANPGKDLSLEAEIEKVTARLEQADGFELEVLEHATFKMLAEHLHEEDCHILHFMGHGDFVDQNGVLVFEDGPVKSEDLAVLLRREPETRVVVLNACNTARTAHQHDRDPFTGMGAALVRAGMPAVVAMQFPITDDAAIAFAERFYKVLAAGQPVESAVTEGRMAIIGMRKDTTEWATPVLFAQTASDRLFRKRETERSRRRPSPDADDLRLQPYMVDRREIIDELTLVLRTQREKPGQPLVCIIHGNSDQCQVALRERLSVVELPRKLRLNSRREMVRMERLRWPRTYRTRDDLHALLTENLGLALLDMGEASREEICSGVSRLPVIMLHSTIYSNEWKNYPNSLIEDYVAYWQQWPQAHSSRWLLFLEVTYKSGATGWFGRRKAKKLCEEIESSLQALPPQAFPQVAFRVLPRLGDIRLEDAERWAEDHGYLDWLPTLRDFYGERPAVQMEELSQKLKKLLKQKYPTQTAGAA